jgi:2-polyprenyl-6-methoxyphenol hydroxylase-like FAD-dependent oxidoreductase
VDEHLLIAARGLRSGVTDAALLDEALKAFLAQQRSMEIDAAYAAYDRHPLNEPDEWGDLASFRAAAATT